MPDSVVVYHSEAERAFDQWLNSGGYGTVAQVAIAFLAVVFIGWVFNGIREHRRKMREMQERNKRFFN